MISGEPISSVAISSTFLVLPFIPTEGFITLHLLDIDLTTLSTISIEPTESIFDIDLVTRSTAIL